jgi:hypothetical protein
MIGGLGGAQLAEGRRRKPTSGSARGTKEEHQE